MALADWHLLRSILSLSNRAASRPDHPCIELRTRFVLMDRRGAWRLVRGWAEGLAGAGWRVTDESPASYQLQLSRRLPPWGVCEVQLTLWPADPPPSGWAAGRPRTAIDLAAVAKVAPVDLGVSGRAVRDLFAGIEAALQQIDPPVVPGAGRDKPG